ncbi:hypothetical protein ABEB36_010845 [Hypothenemus hampei]|uniref:DUF4773 domain-containing protein n=1 Tax=Hypothenemus hampei TaxID=57062 RepID=A0ABD1ED79_HYPHA
MQRGQVYIFVLIGLAAIKESKTQSVSERNSTVIASTPGTIAPVITSTRKPILPSFKLPCRCANGECGCCTGYILDRFNQKACLNMTYEPEEFAVHAVMTLNDVPFYKNTLSGKNPPPMCVRLPRFRFLRLCVEFSNVYFLDKNAHLCVDADVNWDDFTLLQWSFDCIRMGLSGVQVVGPEDGGGLPVKPIDSEDQTDEDYDDSARENVLDTIKDSKIVFHESLSRILHNRLKNRGIRVKKGKYGRYIIYSPK